MPCTSKKPYTTSYTWRFVLKNIKTWRYYVELAAVDCITNPRTGKPFGIVHEKEQFLTVNLDERPNPKKLSLLIPAIREKLRIIAPKYDCIISYINVKVYWKAIQAVKKEFDIRMLPLIYHNEDGWNVKYSKITPRAALCAFINELKSELSTLNQ